MCGTREIRRKSVRFRRRPVRPRTYDGNIRVRRYNYFGNSFNMNDKSVVCTLCVIFYRRVPRHPEIPVQSLKNIIRTPVFFLRRVL